MSPLPTVDSLTELSATAILLLLITMITGTRPEVKGRVVTVFICILQRNSLSGHKVLSLCSSLDPAESSLLDRLVSSLKEHV